MSEDSPPYGRREEARRVDLEELRRLERETESLCFEAEEAIRTGYVASLEIDRLRDRIVATRRCRFAIPDILDKLERLRAVVVAARKLDLGPGHGERTGYAGLRAALAKLDAK